jgi:hypothetical protein
VPSVPRLLIVNADDWGRDAATTDAVAECFAAGRVTSATAMVFMADSLRAAQLARAVGLPVGLHLNLSEGFTATDVPEGVRRAQSSLLPRFSERGRRWRRWIPDPRIDRAVERCVADQLTCFQALYGGPPTHVDGHHHVQVSPTVARTPALAALPLRRALSHPRGSPPVALARYARHRLVLARAAGTDSFLSIASIADDLLAGRAPALLADARDEVVEVMAHPGLERDRELLLSEAWARVLAGNRLGSYADL